MCKNGNYVSPFDKISGNFKEPLFNFSGYLFSRRNTFQAKNILLLTLSLIKKHQYTSKTLRPELKLQKLWRNEHPTL